MVHSDKWRIISERRKLLNVLCRKENDTACRSCHTCAGISDSYTMYHYIHGGNKHGCERQKYCVYANFMYVDCECIDDCCFDFCPSQGLIIMPPRPPGRHIVIDG